MEMAVDEFERADVTDRYFVVVVKLCCYLILPSTQRDRCGREHEIWVFEKPQPAHPPPEPSMLSDTSLLERLAL